MSLHNIIRYNSGQTRTDELNQQAIEDYRSAARSWQIVAGLLILAVFIDYVRGK